MCLEHALWPAAGSGGWQDKHCFPPRCLRAVEGNDETDLTVNCSQRFGRGKKIKEKEKQTISLCLIYFHSSKKM